MMTDFLESKIDDGLERIEKKLGESVRAEHQRIDDATEDVKKLYAAAAEQFQEQEVCINTLVAENNNTFAEHKQVIEGMWSKAEAIAVQMNQNLEQAQQRMQEMISEMQSNKYESDELRRDIDNLADIQRIELQQVFSNSETAATDYEPS